MKDVLEWSLDEQVKKTLSQSWGRGDLNEERARTAEENKSLLDVQEVDSTGPGSQMMGQAGVLGVEKQGKPQRTGNGGAVTKWRASWAFFLTAIPGKQQHG